MNAMAKKESFFIKKFIEILNREMIPLEIIDTSGNRYSTAQQNIKHKIHIKDRKVFKAFIAPNAFSLGEAYVKGYFDISGSIHELYELACEKLLSTDQKRGLLSIVSKLFLKAKEREKENIEYHYDVPSSFYRTFLGETMGYTCGYYAGEQFGMDDAQNEKMDIICKKLRLKPGEKFLDIGCGWGNLGIFAARHFGADVTGITLSQEQKLYAEKWIENEGMASDVRIELLNYRDLGRERYDKIACVGMSEHVGKANMPYFFDRVYKCLKKGGLFMQHTITTNVKRKKWNENSFLDRYMFPGGELMFEHDLVRHAASSGFELLNAENFRTHYIETLNDWIRGMELNREKLLKMVSDKIYRIYHVFFIGSMIAFRSKNISLYQNLFYKTDMDNTSTDQFLSAYSKNETRLA